MGIERSTEREMPFSESRRRRTGAPSRPDSRAVAAMSVRVPAARFSHARTVGLCGGRAESMSAGRGGADVAVIGAGLSGLASLKALREQEVAVEGFERGSDVGGLGRYENDNGLSGAYGSLRTNVSRSRMQYPSFPMPESYGDFPRHSEMAAYLGAYAEASGLRASIRFGASVERLEAAADGCWWVTLDDRSRRSYGAVVVATGVFWSPRLACHPGSFDGTVSHCHAYRMPARFAGRRLLVVGAGQSAAEIAVEVSAVAERTFMSLRGGLHVIPRWVGRRPYDAGEVAPLNRLPWRLLNLIYDRRAARALGPTPASWPLPAHRLLEAIPIVSSDLLPAVRRGDIVAKRAIDRLIPTACASSTDPKSGSTTSSAPPATGSASPSCPHRWCRPTVASCRCTGGSLRPSWAGCTSPASSTRLGGCSRWWRRRGNGSPPCSPDGSASGAGNAVTLRPRRAHGEQPAV
jgi:hypothetical protein